MKHLDTPGIKRLLYNRMLAELAGFGIGTVEADSNPDTPWGAYIRVREDDYGPFAAAYWQGVEIPRREGGVRLAPKVLLVAPGARLSLQYHHRRGEHWRVLDGPVGIVTGAGPDSLSQQTCHPGDVVRIPCGQWHRLVGLETHGRIAEIWEHMDPANPSDETDIVRVEDDYGR